MNHQSLFTCGAVNTVSDGLLWVPLHCEGRSQGSFVAYAVHNLVAIVELRTKTVVRTLRVSPSIVTAIRYCSFVASGLVVLTCACEDGSVHVWTHSSHDNLSVWNCVAALVGLEGSTAALDCFALGNNALVTAADSKGNVLVWLVAIHGSSLVVRVSNFRLPPAQMAKSLLISELPSLGAAPNLLLIVGSVDARIHLYAAKASVTALLAGTIDSTESISSLFSSVGVVSGHEEWVTCLSALNIDSKSMFVASGSQDSKVRVWQIKAQPVTNTSTNEAVTDSISAELEVESDAVEGEVIVEIDEDELESEARLKFVVEGVQYAVLLESLLVGHEDWVTSVTWMPTVSANGSEEAEYRLFSTSMDRNMVIWSPDASAGGVWVPSVRMGDIGGALGGSIGGNLLGFVGGCVSPSGASLMGVGYGGSFHLWTQDAFSQDGEKGRWAPVPFGSGHFGSVNDLCWCDDTTGPYLTTISADQTCRIFAPLLDSLADSGYTLASDVQAASAETKAKESASQVWREISRPQIHGYDLNCLVQAPQAGVHMLYTAGEEKLIRVFDAPATVLRGLEKLAGIQQPLTEEAKSGSNRIEQAYIPELGLSNKAQEFMSKQEQTEQEARSVSSINWTAPPLESQLADFTLWPETDKMFGHNNEVMCMAMSHNGAFIASASKARDAGTAQVLLWGRASAAGTGTGGSTAQGVMQLLCKLPGHESTAVCLEFSPDNRYLASSGKDRSLCLYAHNPITNTYETVVIKKSAHKRIVWGCSWTQDSSHLITVARDGFAKVWRVVLQTDETGAQQVIDLLAVHSFSPFAGAAVTAVDVCRSGPLGKMTAAQGSSANSWLVALGAESGDLQVWQVGPVGNTSDESTEYVSQALLVVPEAHAHGATVRRLRWRPQHLGEASEQSSWELASCGEDRTVRVHQISL